jgi:hypothetical protein
MEYEGDPSVGDNKGWTTGSNKLLLVSFESGYKQALW